MLSNLLFHFIGSPLPTSLWVICSAYLHLHCVSLACRKSKATWPCYAVSVHFWLLPWCAFSGMGVAWHWALHGHRLLLLMTAPSSSYGCLAPWRISMVQQCHLSPFSLRQGGTTHHCRVASSVDAVMVTGRRQHMKWAFGLPACVWRQRSGNVLCATAVPPRRPLRATPG